MIHDSYSGDARPFEASQISTPRDEAARLRAASEFAGIRDLLATILRDSPEITLIDIEE